MKQITPLLIFFLITGFVSADCSGGYLEILSIGDRIAGETVSIIVRTNVSMENQTQTRNLDLYLQDDYHNNINIQKTQFSNTNQETSIEFQIPTNENTLNSSYRVKADMQLINKTNITQVICGQITYSNWFKIRSDRQHYSLAPLKFDISSKFELKEYKYFEKKCLDGTGRCIGLNVSGYMPANYTPVPMVVWLSENITPGNITYQVSESYSGAYLLNLANNISSCTSSLTLCLNNLGNKSITEQEQYSKIQELNARIDSANNDYKRISQEYLTYKTDYPYKPSDAFIIGAVCGVVALIAYMFFHNRKATTEDIHDEVT